MLIGPETDRDMSYFLYRTRYPQVVGNADTRMLYEKGRKPYTEDDIHWLRPLLEAVKSYVVDFADGDLERMDTAVRRRINTEKG